MMSVRNYFVFSFAKIIHICNMSHNIFGQSLLNNATFSVMGKDNRDKVQNINVVELSITRSRNESKKMFNFSSRNSRRFSGKKWAFLADM